MGLLICAHAPTRLQCQMGCSEILCTAESTVAWLCRSAVRVVYALYSSNSTQHHAPCLTLCNAVQAGMDVSEQLTRFGAWQPSGSSSGRGPTVVDALIGSLGGHGAPEKVRLRVWGLGLSLHLRGCPVCLAGLTQEGVVIMSDSSSGPAADLQVLVDIGAGSGYLALAAASRGHRTIAFELDRVALASLNASLAFNGFHRHVTVHQVRSHSRACSLHAVALPGTLEGLPSVSRACWHPQPDCAGCNPACVASLSTAPAQP